MKPITKNKKGVSIMIGYILLISIAIAISGGVYVWLKSYVPQDTLKCPDGVSISIIDFKCDVSSSELEITVRNNGRFNYEGYLIYANNLSENSPAIIDLSRSITSGGLPMNPGVQITGGFFSPGDIAVTSFQISSEINSLELTPIRLGESNNKKKILICSDSSIREKISC